MKKQKIRLAVFFFYKKKVESQSKLVFLKKLLHTYSPPTKSCIHIFGVNFEPRISIFSSA